MRKDRFTDEALAAAKALAALKYSENPEDQLAYAEAYDFARCQRPDGSFYGTSGQCRKGKEAGAKQEEPKTAKTPKSGSSKSSTKKESKPHDALAAKPWEKWQSGKKKPRDLSAVQGEFRKVDKAFDKLLAEHKRNETRQGKGALGDGTKLPWSKELKALDAKRADLYYEREAARKEARRAKKKS